MKDKLRESAVKIIHDSESLPMLEISKGIYRLQKFNDGEWASLDDDELLDILYTEGEGMEIATYKDAARYHYLRKEGEIGCVINGVDWMTFDELDAAIDGAIQEQAARYNGE